MFRYFNNILEIKDNELFMKSVEALIRKTKIDLDLVQKKKVEVIGENNVPVVKEQPQRREKLDDSFDKNTKTDGAKKIALPATFDARPELHFELDDLDSPKSADNEKDAILDIIPDIILPNDRKSKDKDLFRSYFCRHFDSILKINKNEALNLEKQITDPVVLELKNYVNIESVQQSWAILKTYSFKDRVLLKLLMIWRWMKKAASFIFVELIFCFLRDFFTNQFVIIFIETVLAIIYVVYSQPSYFLYPIIFWIFVNVYPKFNSILALNMKIWLLMIPTGINSLIAKQQVNPEVTNSTNEDFNFKFKGDYHIFDISTLGVVLMSFVILEMIIMSSKNAIDKSSEQREEDLTRKEIQRGSSTFIMIVNILYSNAIYLIMINIYVIALDINIISLVLIIYFIRLILVHEVGDKTFYTLFWYNQISILLRYIYSQHKATFQTLADPNLFKLIGVEESDNMSSGAKLLLNFSLQLLLILVIFSKRNRAAIGFIQSQDKEHTSTRRAFGGEAGLNRIIKNIFEFIRFTSFHSVPWISYLLIYLAMVLATTSIITLLELFLLSYVFIKHCRLCIEQRFGGLQFMRGSWRMLIIFCAVMALSRYCLWFITQPYLQSHSNTVSWLFGFISINLGFIGLLPSNLSQSYLELLPSFISMYFGSLVLHRINMIEYTLKNHDEIMRLDILEADVVPTVEMVKIENKVDDDQLSNKPPSDEQEPKPKKKFTIFGRKPTRKPSDDLSARLKDQEDQSKLEDRVLKLSARRDVIGDINMLR
jgi:hypothetical protein